MKKDLVQLLQDSRALYGLRDAFTETVSKIIYFESLENKGGKRRTDIIIQRLVAQQQLIREQLRAGTYRLESNLEAASNQIIYGVRDVDADSAILVQEVSDELLGYLATHPNSLYTIEPRLFEKLIAEIFRGFGYDVELTPATHDGGKDIILRTRTAVGDMLAYVECKRNRLDRPVGIGVVQRLYGIQQAERATRSIVVTTSSFSKPAIAFAKNFSFLISLRNYDDIMTWLEPYAQNKSSI
jgi:restriction endonuclease Mrr